MTKKLLMQAIAKLLAGIILVGFLIFFPAGTFSFINGWIFMGILFIPMLIFGIILMLKNPMMLRKRLNAKEEDNRQKIIITLSGIMFIAGFIASGLSFRFDTGTVSKGTVAAATVVFFIGYALYAEVIRENKYLSRIIEIQENQEVVDTGLYSIVRHPMYSATLLLFLSTPLVLGSLYSFFIFLFYPFIIAKRIKGEEEFLEKELPGYSDYKKLVKYRLIPFIW